MRGKSIASPRSDSPFSSPRDTTGPFEMRKSFPDFEAAFLLFLLATGRKCPTSWLKFLKRKGNLAQRQFTGRERRLRAGAGIWLPAAIQAFSCSYSYPSAVTISQGVA